MMSRVLRITALILLLLLGLLALYGSWLLIRDPSGNSIQIPLALLDATPFEDYLIPGLLLLLSIGIPSFIIALLIIRKAKHYAILIVIQGILLAGSLTGELIVNVKFFTPHLHYPLYTISFVLIFIGLWLYRSRNKQANIYGNKI